MDHITNSTPLFGPVAQNITFTTNGISMTLMFTGDSAEDIAAQLDLFAPDATNVVVEDANDQLKDICANFALAS